MNLTKNSWHYNFYTRMFGYKPNNNFCDYFWGLVLLVVLFPISWFGLFFPKDNTNKLLQKVIITILLNCIILPICFGFYRNWKETLLFVTMTTIAIGAILLLFYLGDKGKLDWMEEKGGKIVDNIFEIVSIAKEGFNSFKGKYCPKINWK